MIKYKIKFINKEACKIALQRFKESGDIDSEGIRKIGLSATLDWIYEWAIYDILYWGLEIKPNIPEFTKREILNQALKRWSRYKKYKNNPDFLKSFEKAVFVELGNLVDSKEKYFFVAFLNLQKDDSFMMDGFDINETNIRIFSWDEASNYHLEDVWRNCKEHLPKNLDDISANKDRLVSYFSPVFITVNSFHRVDALYKALDNIDLFRVALNYSSAISLTAKFGQTFPLSRFRSSPVYGVFDSNGTLIDSECFTNEFWFPQSHMIKENEFEIALYIIDKVTSQSGLWKLISVVLYLYQQALDLTEEVEVFLALWRVLEKAVLDYPERHVNINARIVHLTGIENDPILTASIEMLSTYRNNLVHKGEFPHKFRNLIFLLKKVVDFTIERLIQLSDKFENIHEYNEYLNLLSINNKELERKSKVIKLIQASRSG